MKKLSIVFILFFTFFIVSCGDSDNKETDDETVNDNETTDVEEMTDEMTDETTDETVDEVADKEVDDETTDDVIAPITCADLVEGLNEGLYIGEDDNELERSFYLRLPKDVESKDDWPVVFLFHGYGDSAPNFEKLLTGQVNNSEMPFILVTPRARSDVYSFDSLPPKGLDWDMISLFDGSAEADLFDGILGCLEEKYGTDENHIHLAGFSAGAITSDSIGLLRSDKIASIFTYSGAYFSNELNRDDLGEIGGYNVGSFFTWPDFEEEHNKYPQVLVSGAEGKDTWSVSGTFTIEFQHMSMFDANYLTDLGHNVILCNHGGSHTNAGLTSADMITFFKDHPLGTNLSPYKDGLPDGWDICEYRDQPVEISDDEVGDDDSETTDDDSL